MKKKMNIIFTLPGIEICIMLLLSLFMPLVSYNSGSYKLYNGITILSYSSIDLSKEYVNALNSLRNFVIVTLILLFVMAIVFLVIGLANKQFMAGAVISIISSVCILIMEMFAYISITGVRDKGISVKFGFLFILLSTIGILVYDIVMGCIKSENEIEKMCMTTIRFQVILMEMVMGKISSSNMVIMTMIFSRELLKISQMRYRYHRLFTEQHLKG